MAADRAEWEMETDLAPPRRGRWLRWLIVPAVMFVAGAFAMAYALTHWDAAARFLRPPRVVTLAAPVPPRAAQPMMRPGVVPAPADPGLAVRVAALETGLGRANARADAAQGDAGRAEGLLVAFAARRALDRGVQLGYVEGLLRERFGGSQPQAVAAVIAAAHRPITLADLQAGLDRIAPALVAADARVNWWGGFRTELANLIVLRRAEQPSTAPGDRLLRARRALEQGQADVALAEVARLPGRSAATDWIAAARRYAAARSALDVLETAALLAPHAPEPPSIVPDVSSQTTAVADGD